MAGLGILSWYNSLVVQDGLIVGGELYDFLVKRKRVKEPIAQKMFAQLCGAVAYIHNAGCVHR
jgi:serine/threonine protein kinase